MMAIEALGRRGDPAAALPLARCALAHPVDVTQGLAIVRAVAKLRRDESWNDAVRLLHDHPVRAVARTARELHTPKHAATTLVPGSPDREAEVQASIDDLANRVDATERIMALGEHAIAPLRRYLREGAQVIPHP